MFQPKNFAIPTPLHIDNSTLQSLDDTYNMLDQDLTRRSQEVRKDISRSFPHGFVYNFGLCLFGINHFKFPCSGRVLL